MHGHVLERAHVVQPVGELDDDDPPIISHGNEHRAQVLDLLLQLLVLTLRSCVQAAQRAQVLTLDL